MENLKVYKCGNTYKYISIPILKNGTYDLSYKKNVSNLEKLENNIIRAKTKIKDYILCNDFHYFITITLSSKYDRFDLLSLQKKVSQRIRDARRNNLCVLKYILIPEQHKNGAWHLHGVLSQDFYCFMKYNQFNYLTCSLFDTLGFNSISIINSKDRVGSYITKYITKDLAKREKGKHLYFASNGLLKPMLVDNIIYKSSIDWQFFDFVNNYCAIRYDSRYFDMTFLR